MVITRVNLPFYYWFFEHFIYCFWINIEKGLCRNNFDDKWRYFDDNHVTIIKDPSAFINNRDYKDPCLVIYQRDDSRRENNSQTLNETLILDENYGSEASSRFFNIIFLKIGF